MSIIYSSQTLSSIESLNLSPLILTEPQSSPADSSLHSIIPSLTSSLIPIPAKSYLASLSITDPLLHHLSTQLSCKCGRLASSSLPCNHSICETCLVKLSKSSNESPRPCPTCSTPIPIYTFSTSRCFCLSCSSSKPRRFDCPHYCLSCVKYKIMQKNLFSCLICCYNFPASTIQSIQGRCSKCSSITSTCLDLSCGCATCLNCAKSLCKKRKCDKCEKSLSSKELLKLLKHFKSRCVICFELKKPEKFAKLSCCSSKICKTCKLDLDLVHCCEFKS